jgi:hypothetical protein
MDEAAARHQRDAEVLGMSICGPDQPEQNVGLQEVGPVAQRLVTTLKQAADLNDARDRLRSGTSGSAGRITLGSNPPEAGGSAARRAREAGRNAR